MPVSTAVVRIAQAMSLLTVQEISKRKSEHGTRHSGVVALSRKRCTQGSTLRNDVHKVYSGVNL